MRHQAEQCPEEFVAMCLLRQGVTLGTLRHAVGVLWSPMFRVQWNRKLGDRGEQDPEQKRARMKYICLIRPQPFVTTRLCTPCAVQYLSISFTLEVLEHSWPRLLAGDPLEM